jgi:hypothetical protein
MKGEMKPERQPEANKSWSDKIIISQNMQVTVTTCKYSQ